MAIETSLQKTSLESTVSQKIITPQQLYDPLLVLLKIKLRVDDWWIITVAGMVAAAGMYGVLLFGILKNPLQMLSGSLLVPLLMGLYLFLPSSIAKLFNRLWENGVIGEHHADQLEPISYQDFVEKQALRINSRWWVRIALFFLGLYWLYRLLFAHDTLSHAPFWVQLGIIFIYSLFIYIGFLNTVRLLGMVAAINQLFRIFTIHVKPLHPDSSGGLALLNRFLWMSVTLLIIGVCAVMTLGLHSFDGAYIPAYILIYLIALPLLLAHWLVLPHQVMVQARDEILRPLTSEYGQAISETMLEVTGDTVAINEGTERLAALQKRYEQVRNSFPTWPIEIVQLRHLVIALILPFLLSLLPLLVDVFTKK